MPVSVAIATACAGAYRRDRHDRDVHMLAAGHVALETDTADIARDMRAALVKQQIGRP